VTKAKLQVRKQQLVRDAIYDAAIELFAANGFDQTTVEEVAQAAGVSRRSFFRYYATKDDLLAQSVVSYGAALTAAITASAAALTPLQVMRETVASGIRYTSSQPLTRQIIDISQRSVSARQAHASRLMEVEDSVSAAYAERFKNTSKYDIKPRLLAHLTISILNVAIISWYQGDHKDVSAAAKQVFANLTRLICDNSGSTQLKDQAATGRKLASPSMPRRSAK
jgi:TetR/AcrR family transcriptional regulator, regulator of mycofactocin system